jgi:hypothetical protein
MLYQSAISPDWAVSFWIQSADRLGTRLRLHDCYRHLDKSVQQSVSGKIGQGKRRYGLGLIREKLPATQGSSIAMNDLVMNLQKLMELLYLFFVLCWQLLVSTARALSSNSRELSYQLSGA